MADQGATGRRFDLRGWAAVAWAVVFGGLYVQMIAQSRWDIFVHLARAIW